MFKLKHLFLFLAIRFFLFLLKINPFQYDKLLSFKILSQNTFSMKWKYYKKSSISYIVFHAYFYLLLILPPSIVTNVTTSSFYIKETRWLTLWRFIDKGSNHIVVLHCWWNKGQCAVFEIPWNANATLIIHVYRSIAII